MDRNKHKSTTRHSWQVKSCIYLFLVSGFLLFFNSCYIAFFSPPNGENIEFIETIDLYDYQTDISFPMEYSQGYLTFRTSLDNLLFVDIENYSTTQLHEGISNFYSVIVEDNTAYITSDRSLITYHINNEITTLREYSENIFDSWINNTALFDGSIIWANKGSDINGIGSYSIQTSTFEMLPEFLHQNVQEVYTDDTYLYVLTTENYNWEVDVYQIDDVTRKIASIQVPNVIETYRPLPYFQEMNDEIVLQTSYGSIYHIIIDNNTVHLNEIDDSVATIAAIVEDTIVRIEDYTIRCTNLDGRTVWQRSLSDELRMLYYCGSFQNLFLFSDGKHFRWLDQETGEEFAGPVLQFATSYSFIDTFQNGNLIYIISRNRIDIYELTQ
ncbi:MAG: hypothetical protein ACLFR1_00105 [Spirochaetia bacterium]